MTPDISLVLTLHREGSLLRRTLDSLEEAARFAELFGITTEIVPVLDCADDVTRDALAGFDASAFVSCRIVEVENGSLGPSRNDGIAVASGRYLAMCDGDDLISFNALAEMLHAAETEPAPALYFPEWLFAFGASFHATRYYGLDDVTPLAFLQMHPYVSRVFAASEVFRAHPYRDLRLTRGYAYEDWDFNATCVAEGWDIRIVPDTILFYRQRSESLLAQANRLSVRQIAPNRLHHPEIFLRYVEAYQRATRTPEQFRHDRRAVCVADFDRPILRSLIRAANSIDPEINVALLRDSGRCYANVVERGVQTGGAYFEIVDALREHGPFDEIFLLPFIGAGGAEIYFNNLIESIIELCPSRRLLIILGETALHPAVPCALPSGVTVVDLGSDHMNLSCEDRLLITLRLIEQLGPGARLHLRDSRFASAFFRTYWPVLIGHESWFYRFSDAVVCEAGEAFRMPTGFSFVSEQIERLTRVISDTDGLVSRDRARIGLWPERFTCLPGFCRPATSAIKIAARSAKLHKRVLWASRLDREKRPGLVPTIADRLARVDPAVHIDMYGHAVLENFDTAILDGHPNLTWRGPYDGFRSLDVDSYDAFLYTSWYDGMPNVVLEAVATGLPVIAPDVGGIGEFIENGKTGLLLPSVADDEAAAEVYVAAILQLIGSASLRQHLAEAALAKLEQRHGPEIYRTHLSALLGDIGVVSARGAAYDS